MTMWPWSKQAIKDFWRFAATGGGRFNIRAGLDAALATDLPELTPSMARYWVTILTGPEMTPRAVELSSSQYYISEEGVCSLRIPITRALLMELLDLPDLEEPPEPTGAPVPAEPPTPVLTGAAAAEAPAADAPTSWVPPALSPTHSGN